MKQNARLIGCLLLAVLLELPVYIFLHEGGHTLVALACGANITAFSITGAYMSTAGGVFTPFRSALLYAAGAGLPLLVSVCYMLFGYNRNRGGNFYRSFSFFFSIAPVYSLIAWVFVPVAYTAGDTNNPDDVIQFLNHSGLHPVVVMAASLLLVAAVVWLAWKRDIIQAWLGVIQEAIERNKR